VEGALHIVAHDLAQAQRGAAMGALVARAAHLAVGIAPHHQLFPQPRDAQGLARLDLAGIQDAVPLVPDHHLS
jgi:hypothetical protein